MTIAPYAAAMANESGYAHVETIRPNSPTQTAQSPEIVVETLAIADLPSLPHPFAKFAPVVSSSSDFAVRNALSSGLAGGGTLVQLNFSNTVTGVIQPTTVHLPTTTRTTTLSVPTTTTLTPSQQTTQPTTPTSATATLTQPPVASGTDALDQLFPTPTPSSSVTGSYSTTTATLITTMAPTTSATPEASTSGGYPTTTGGGIVPPSLQINVCVCMVITL